MATKAVPEDTYGSFFLWATRERLNADVIAEEDGQYGTNYALRLRPWKQDKRYPKMFIGAGLTLLDAMRVVVGVYRTGEEQSLDYAFRPWRGPTVAGSATDWEAPF